MAAEPRSRTDGYPARTAGATDRRGTTATGLTAADGERSIGDLLRELSSEGADLVRQEVALAKAEMDEKLSVFQRNMVSIAMGAAILLAGMLAALWAVNRGLTALLTLFVPVEVAIWLSPLILAVALGMIGSGMIQKGKTAIAREGITPHHTKETLQDDKRWAQRKAHEVKEEMKHG